MKNILFIILLIITTFGLHPQDRDYFWPITIEVAPLNSVQSEIALCPVGWSRDGKTALIIEHYRADIATVTYTYLIVDLVTDS